MPTVGIKTSLHECRHAIIGELLGKQVQEIKVIERYQGCTRYAPVTINPIENLFTLIAPYVKRIKQFDWNRFMSEYGGLSDIVIAHELIDKAKSLNVFDRVVDEIDVILDLNQELIKEVVAYLDRNGKGHPEKVDRNHFKLMIARHPLQGGTRLMQLFNEVDRAWGGQ